MNIIKVNYETATTAYRAKQLIDEIKNYPLIAWDFETAIKYTLGELDAWKKLLERGGLTRIEQATLQSRVEATPLDHPSHCTITHCSMAVSENQAFVFIFDNPMITRYVLNYLVTTSQRQVLHNASYDLRFLEYFTHKFPKDFEDTAILAKTLLNHVDTYKARVGLKELAGHMYGDWGISEENFDVSQMYEPKVLRYAATDACATYWLWDYMNKQCDRIDQSLLEKYDN